MTEEVMLIRSGALLNFARSPFVLIHPWYHVPAMTTTGHQPDILPWLYVSAEHYFQAMKSLYQTDTDWVELHDYIASPEITAREAKNRGREVHLDTYLWDLSSFGHMLEGHRAKFHQNAGMRRYLLSTGEKTLVEHRPDPLWGDNLDGTGKNLCGKSLMLTRAMMRNYFG